MVSKRKQCHCLSFCSKRKSNAKIDKANPKEFIEYFLNLHLLLPYSELPKKSRWTGRQGKYLNVTIQAGCGQKIQTGLPWC